MKNAAKFAGNNNTFTIGPPHHAHIPDFDFSSAALPSVRSGRGGDRGGDRIHREEFNPPETWHEPPEKRVAGYRVISRYPGDGHEHILTPDQVIDRILAFPPAVRDQIHHELDVIELATNTRKKQLMSMYGMHWGTAIYLYPLPAPDKYGRRVESWIGTLPSNSDVTLFRRFGGKVVVENSGSIKKWRAEWSRRAIEDFYTDHILPHELGHLLDPKFGNYFRRESRADHFAAQWGRTPDQYKNRPIKKRHHHK